MTESLPPPGSYKFCQHCGQQINKGVNTCPSCGKSTGGNKALTIIIILAVVGCLGFGSLVFVGIFAAIALPNFIGAQQKAKNAAVKANMRTCQIAAESYAVDHAGFYPESVNDDAFKAYFPGGQPPNKPGLPPHNPITGVPEWPVQGNITELSSARQMGPGLIGKGVVEYSVIFDSKQEPLSYAIRGGGATGQAVSGAPGSTLVLSNQ